MIKDMSIGKNGLTVDGKRASNIGHLDDLIDLPEILGQGSFGVVRKVKHKQTGVIYAKKVQTAHHGSHTDALSKSTDNSVRIEPFFPPLTRS